MRDEDTDNTRLHRLPGTQLWVGGVIIGLSFGEGINTECQEKASVRCPCIRLASLHGAPRMRR